MTVEELIKELLKHDPQMKVMFEDECYEFDVEEVKIEKDHDGTNYILLSGN